MVRVSCHAIHVNSVPVRVKQVYNLLQVSILNLIFKKKQSMFTICIYCFNLILYVMKTKIFYLAMYILAVLPLMTACESDEPTAIDEPKEQTQLATPVVTVNVDMNAKTIIASWQAVENADNYHYKISGDETLYETGETRLELQPYSKFEGGSHSITVQAVSNARPDLFSPSEWGKADFSVGSTKLQAPDALNADVDKESCTVTVTWAPVANAASYLYKIDDGKEVPVSEPEISFSLFDYAPGEHSASVRAVTAVASSDWSEVYTFTITDEPLPGVLGNKPLGHARLGDFYLNDGSLLRGDSELSAELADACIGIVAAPCWAAPSTAMSYR